MKSATKVPRIEFFSNYYNREESTVGTAQFLQNKRLMTMKRLRYAKETSLKEVTATCYLSPHHLDSLVLIQRLKLKFTPYLLSGLKQKQRRIVTLHEYWSARATIVKCQRLVSLNSRNLFSCSSAG
jgi:hypothetical protein